jgi:hypothetical protein
MKGDDGVLNFYLLAEGTLSLLQIVTPDLNNKLT